MYKTGLPPPYSLNEEQDTDLSTVQSLRNPPPWTPSDSRPSLRPGPEPEASSDSSPNPSLGVRTLTPIPATTHSPSHSDLTTPSVGTKNLKRPLVTIAQVKSHLRLLRAFKLFQRKVEDLYSYSEAADVVPPIARSVGAKGRLLWFLEMAVERCVCVRHSR